ncbi:hypothetical protein H1C71_033228, partial [Ictidomys tridecemlineatus]
NGMFGKLWDDGLYRRVKDGAWGREQPWAVSSGARQEPGSTATPQQAPPPKMPQTQESQVWTSGPDKSSGVGRSQVYQDVCPSITYNRTKPHLSTTGNLLSIFLVPSAVLKAKHVSSHVLLA